MINLYEKPLEIMDRLPQMANAEMSSWQSAYLCGLIKEKRPGKLVEIGVAAGGTTAIVLNCVAQLNIECEIYSLDISSEYYRDRAYATGFLAEYAKKQIKKQVKHSMLIGIAPDYMDKVGKGIDFLILDTVHMLPGEILDFLICLPYLSEDAVVVLHDVAIHHFAYSDMYSWATQILLDAVVADKLPVFGADNEFGYPNIGAFRINGDTMKYIYDVFSTLILTWQYIPREGELQKYRSKLVEAGYPERCISVFDCACAMNRSTINKRTEGEFLKIHFFHEFIRKYENRNIFLYGAGNLGRKVYRLLNNYCKISGFIVSDNQKINAGDEKVYHFSEIIPKIGNVTVLVAVGVDLQKEILGELEKRGIKNVECLEAEMCNSLFFM